VDYRIANEGKKGSGFHYAYNDKESQRPRGEKKKKSEGRCNDGDASLRLRQPSSFHHRASEEEREKPNKKKEIYLQSEEGKKKKRERNRAARSPALRFRPLVHRVVW